ncbi:hypothetical protein HHI36_018933, partial [Cryptolaemus montrouzieri]
MFGKVVSGNLINKHKLWKYEGSAICYKRLQKSSRQSTLVPTVQTRRGSVASKYFQIVRKFYENNDNGRIGAGKRECVTSKVVKKHKRYLLDSIANLYEKFRAKNFKISYQTFCRLRPFWVLTPKVNDHDTYNNIDLKLTALYSRKILPYNCNTKL